MLSIKTKNVVMVLIAGLVLTTAFAWANGNNGDVNAGIANVGVPFENSTLYVGGSGLGNYSSIQDATEGSRQSNFESTLLEEHIDNSNGEYWVPNQVIVGFKDNISMNERISLIQKYNGICLKSNNVLDMMLVEVNMDEKTFINNIREESGVRYAGHNWICHLAHIPNDPYWNNQWGPQKIKCPQAWDHEVGDTSVVIAIIDTGIDYTHPDLVDHYMVGGYDWENDDNDPMDDYGHGTHCAGIAIATMDNSIGISGVAQVSFIAEKVLDEHGNGGDVYRVASGIQHAIDLGANIISMSIGFDLSYPGVTPGGLTAVQDACQYAYNHNVLLIAASGNDYAGVISYPAKFSTVIAVGATDQYDGRASFSNYGPELELVAPGVNIYSTMPTYHVTLNNYYNPNTRQNYLKNYDYMSGTSMATPHVVGLAALLRSRTPGLSNSEYRTWLRYTTDDLGPPGWDNEYGYGRINAYKAVTANHAPYAHSPNPSDGAENVPITLDNLSWDGGDVDGDTVWYDVYFEANDPTPDNLVETTYSESWEIPYALNYLTHYYWKVVAHDEHGATNEPAEVWDFWTVNVPGPGTPHSCIYINGNDDFTSANGVVSGSGTSGNPYIIENWDIIPDSDAEYGIRILNTDAYFIIRNVCIHDGGSNRGIMFYNVNHGTVENCQIYNNYYGVSLSSSANCVVKNNDIHNNTGNHGICLAYGSGNHLIKNNRIYNCLCGIFSEQCGGCTIHNNSVYIDPDFPGNEAQMEGIRVGYSSGNTISDNTIYNLFTRWRGAINLYEITGSSFSDNVIFDCGLGIRMHNCNGNTFTSNALWDNEYNFGFIMSQYHTYTNNIDTSNTVNGKPIRYLISQSDLVLDGNGIDAGYIGLIQCNNITVRNFTIHHNFQGILLAESDNCTIENCALYNHSCGIGVISSEHNLIRNSILYNIDYPVSTAWIMELWNSNNNLIYNNYLDTSYNAIDDGFNYYNLSTLIPETNIIGGPYLGGNYWSNYAGNDQDCNGIGDTPKNIGGGSNKDYFPLMIPNLPPMVNFSYSPTDPESNEIIQFFDLSLDMDGEIINWTWNFGDGNISYEQNPQHQYSDDGIYNVTLAVTDDDGASDTVSKNITVSVVDTTPPEISNVQDYPDPQITEGWVNITCNVTDNVAVDTVMANITGPTGFTPVNVSMNEGSYYYNATYTIPGTYYYFIWANDTSNNGNTSTTYNFTITPVLTADADGPYSGVVNESIQFNGSASGGTLPYNWSWDFGDGNTSNEKNPTHTYATSGNYTVTLTVADADMDTDDDTTWANVVSPPPTTIIKIVPSIKTFNQGQMFEVNVEIDPAEPIRTVSFDLGFNPDLLQVNSISDGVFDIFVPCSIDNVGGFINGSCGSMYSLGTVSTPSIIATINFTASSINTGTTTLDLFNLAALNATGVSVTVVDQDGSVTVSPPIPPWDVRGPNKYEPDHICNFWDLDAVTSNWLKTTGIDPEGADCNGPEGVPDGIVNFWDLDMVTSHWLQIW